MSYELETLIKCLSHSGTLKILRSLKSSTKRQKDLINELGLDKTIIWRRIRELFNLGLIEVTFIPDAATGSKAYQLSPLGQKIVRHIEEMQKEFEEWHYQPESDEEFLEGGWDKRRG